MKLLTNKDWWIAAGTRAIRTVAQTAGAMLGGAIVFSDVNWSYVASASLFAGLLSLLMSIAGLPEVEEE